MTKLKSSTIKISFRRFVKNKSFGERIQIIVDLINKIVTETYHLCNLHILCLLENGKPISKEGLDKLSFYFRVGITSTLLQK